MTTIRMIPDPNKPLNECICNPKHFAYATKCMDLLKSFCNLKVYEARCHGIKPYPYTCWYVSFNHIHDEKICIILHFDIRSSDIYVYFRFQEYVPQDMVPRWAWGIRGKWIYVHFNAYTESKLREIIELYLKNIQDDFDKDKLQCRKWHVRS